MGYEATILADICDAVLEARKQGKLTKRYERIAAQCEILVRGFARVGIIALVDEATGYQADRARDGLAKILEAFVAKELRKWVKTFPAEFYQELFRLRGSCVYGQRQETANTSAILQTTSFIRDSHRGFSKNFAHKLRGNEKGQLKHKLFQRLTEDVGHPQTAGTLSIRDIPNEGVGQVGAIHEEVEPRIAAL